MMILHTSLGRTGLDVSRLALGTMNFGWRTDEATSFAILDAFRAAGGNFLETAAIFPALTLPAAATSIGEKIIGRWLVSRGVPRHELVIGTRIHVRASGADVSLEKLVCDSVRDSLRRLNIEYLDVVVFEWNDSLLPVERALEAFEAVVRQRLVRYIGAANFPSWRVVDANTRAWGRGFPQIEVLQCDYSIMQRARFEVEAMSLCDERDLGFIAASPLAGGFLARRTGRDSFGPASRQWLYRRFNNDYGDAALAALARVAKHYDASSAQVALAWLLGNNAVSSAMVGVRSVAELDELVKACDLRLLQADVDQLSEETLAEEVVVAGESPRAEAVA